MIFQFHSNHMNKLSIIRCQFHQRYTIKFYAQRSQKDKKILTTWMNFYSLGSSQATHRMLMILTLGVNFINVWWEAVIPADLYSAKIQSCSQSFFTLLGSVSKKALSKTLMKLTQVVAMKIAIFDLMNFACLQDNHYLHIFLHDYQQQFDQTNWLSVRSFFLPCVSRIWSYF